MSTEYCCVVLWTLIKSQNPEITKICPFSVFYSIFHPNDITYYISFDQAQWITPKMISILHFSYIPCWLLVFVVVLILIVYNFKYIQNRTQFSLYFVHSLLMNLSLSFLISFLHRMYFCAYVCIENKTFCLTIHCFN